MKYKYLLPGCSCPLLEIILLICKISTPNNKDIKPLIKILKHHSYLEDQFLAQLRSPEMGFERRCIL